MSRITGERISYLRIEQGLSRKQLAEILHVSNRTVDSYEQGVRDPSTKVLRVLVEYFKVSADYILGYTNKPVPLEKISKSEHAYILLPKTIQESTKKYNQVNHYVKYIAQEDE